MSRKSGYYWIILKGSTEWCIGDYDSDIGEWEVGSLSLTDNYISEIDPNPIVREVRVWSNPNPILGNKTYCNRCWYEVEKCICSFHI